MTTSCYFRHLHIKQHKNEIPTGYNYLITVKVINKNLIYSSVHFIESNL